MQAFRLRIGQYTSHNVYDYQKSSESLSPCFASRHTPGLTSGVIFVLYLIASASAMREREGKQESEMKRRMMEEKAWINDTWFEEEG